eukprot:3937231-Rhodomonas_salina.2
MSAVSGFACCCAMCLRAAARGLSAVCVLSELGLVNAAERGMRAAGVTAGPAAMALVMQALYLAILCRRPPSLALAVPDAQLALMRWQHTRSILKSHARKR